MTEPKITSIAELKEWAEAVRSATDVSGGEGGWVKISLVLEKINEQEAGLKEKAGSLFPYKECLKEWRIDCTGMNYCPCSFFCDFIKREILGDDKSGKR